MTLFLEPDSSGKIFVKPVVSWKIGRDKTGFILLAIEYLPRESGEATGPSRTIPLVLTPEQTQLLADSLTKAHHGEFPDPPPVSPSATLC